MVPPTIFVSGTIAILQLCQEIYLKYKSVKRYRDDCKQLCHFVSRVEGFLMETEDEEDMAQPGWQTAFVALHESLLEVGTCFEDCAKFGIVRSIVQADEMNLRLSSIAQRMTMALQLIPIQKAKAADKKLNVISQLQAEMRTAQFSATRAAEQQSAELKRLMDQSRVDASKTQEMIAQVISLLQQDRVSPAAAAAAPGNLEPPGCGPPGGRPPAAAAAAAEVGVQLDNEIQDLQEELMIAKKDKKIIEEQYLAQIISAIESLEVGEPEAIPVAAAAAGAAMKDPSAPTPPRDLLCPITCELLSDPVLLVDSCQTYEREAIEEWLGRGNTKDPVTGIKLTTSTLVPNVLVKKLAREWLEANPQYRRQAAAAAAAAAQHVPGAISAVGVDFTKDASCKGGAQGGKGLSSGKNDDFELNPKAAALLAAVGPAPGSSSGSSGSSKGLPSYFDPSMLGGLDLSSSGGSSRLPQQQGYSVDEKIAAQKAYAAAVAAAAAEEAALSGGVAAYPALRVSQSVVGRQQPVIMTSDTRRLNHVATVGHKPEPAPVAAAASAAAAAPYGADHDEFLLWKQQQQQREAEEFALWQRQRRQSQANSSSSGGRLSLQMHGSDADRMEIWQHQQQGQAHADLPPVGRQSLNYADHVPGSSGSSRQLTLEEQYMLMQQQQGQALPDLPAAGRPSLNHADHVPGSSSSRQLTLEEQYMLMQQQQPPPQQQQQDPRVAAYAAWCQQQQQQQQQQLDDLHQGSGDRSLHSYSSSSRRSMNQRDPGSSDHEISLDHFRATFDRMAETRAQITLKHGSQVEQQRMQKQLALQQQQQQLLQRDSLQQDSGSSSSGAAPIHTARSMPAQQPPAGGSSSSSRPASVPSGLNSATSIGGRSAASSSSGKSGFGGLFKKKNKADVDIDDTASVRSDSSNGTNASRKSVGKSVLGALKNISYTMVYQDDKC